LTAGCLSVLLLSAEALPGSACCQSAVDWAGGHAAVDTAGPRALPVRVRCVCIVLRVGRRAQGAAYRSALLSHTAIPDWYAANAWCAKCNLFAGTPCATDYVAFNLHRDRTSPTRSTGSGAGPAGSAGFPSATSASSAGASASASSAAAGGGDGACTGLAAEDAAAMDNYLGLRLMTCFMANPDIVSPTRIAAAEAAAAAAAAAARGPALYTGSTRAVVDELRERCRVLGWAAAAAAVVPGSPAIPAPPAQPRLSTKELALALRKEAGVIERAFYE
jgi:hypothetical protein